MEDKQNRKRERGRTYIIWAARLLILLCFVLVTLFVGQHLPGRNNIQLSSGTLDSSGEYYNNNKNPGDSSMEEEKTYSTNAPLIKVNTDPSSYTVLVNRDYPMPEDYVPEDLVIPDVDYSYNGIYEKSYMREAAAKALEKMFAAAKKKKKYQLKVVSAYRSYERQNAIYQNNINTRGEEDTNKVSAQPGCSEHQTGLAIDVSSDTVNCTIEKSFASCPEGKWLARNCHNFGFIIRYPEGKSHITGYTYEPWHIRYVGVNLAKYIHKMELTLEEYYQTTTVDDKVPEDDIIKDIDINTPKEPQMTTAPTPKTTAYVSHSPKPLPKPAPTRPPVVTQEPEDTPVPAETPETNKTPLPDKTAKPVKTPKPSKTPKPEPDKTTKPDKTPVPAVTHKPAETNKPDNAPEDTGTPAIAHDPGQEPGTDEIQSPDFQNEPEAAPSGNTEDTP